MNILIVTQYFWPENFRINDLVAGLRERGHNITVLTGIPNYPSGKIPPGYGLLKKRRQMFQGAAVYRVPLWPRGKGNPIRLILNYISFALSASILGPSLCKGEFDLIFVFEPSPITVGIPAIVLKRMKQAPIFFWVQDLWPESLSATGATTSGFILQTVSLLVKAIYCRCDRILVSSEGFIKNIQAMGIPEGKISYFPNWAESLYDRRSGRDFPGGLDLPSGFRLTFAGNIGAAQDFGTILGAAEMLKPFKDIHWIILGEGRKLPWVKEQVQKRGLSSQVHLLGQHPVDAMPDFFACSDALLLTLKRNPIFSLTVPSKLQSYLACGKPIVAAIEGTGREIVEKSGAGISCQPENAAELAGAVKRIYDLPGFRRREMGECGIRFFRENFERQKLMSYLEEIMAAGTHKNPANSESERLKRAI